MDKRAAPPPPNLTIVGERVALGPDRAELLPTVRRWLDDLTLRRTQGGVPQPWTIEATRAQQAARQGDPQSCSFIIYRRADWRPLGFAAWLAIDRHHRTAEFVIGIGEADCRGRGYGTEATRLMLNYAFTVIGLHSAHLTVYAPNLAGLRAYTKAGFREFGRRRESFLFGGTLWDTIYMDCLASDFTGGTLAATFAPDSSAT